jgi:K+-sensing histidine kinase KdpD
MPKKPEEWRDQVPPDEKTKGYAPGVGKSYAMLSEGMRRRGYFED